MRVQIDSSRISKRGWPAEARPISNHQRFLNHNSSLADDLLVQPMFVGIADVCGIGDVRRIADVCGTADVCRIADVCPLADVCGITDVCELAHICGIVHVCGIADVCRIACMGSMEGITRPLRATMPETIGKS